MERFYKEQQDALDCEVKLNSAVLWTELALKTSRTLWVGSDDQAMNLTVLGLALYT